MIVIPAIVAALAPIAEAALVSAVVGGAFSGATCAVGSAVSSYHQHGELNHEIVVSSAQTAADCAAEGALIGGVFGGALAVAAPAVAPALQVVDDLTRPVLQAADDIAKPFTKQVSAAAHSAGMSIQQATNSAIRRIRRVLPSSIGGHLPKQRYNVGSVYAMSDKASGAHKIGRSINPKVRVRQVTSPSGATPKLVCTIPTFNAKALEKSLHTGFASHNLPNTGAGVEWFSLSASSVKAICG